MKTGLLWLDDSKSTMPAKAQKAIDYYQHKYGTPPQVLETSLRDEPLPEGLVLVVKVQRVHIPKSHFLMGVE